MPLLLCDRPHERTIPDLSAVRLICAKSCGMDVGERHLEYGDEVPKGSIAEASLRMLYDTPIHMVELAEFAAQVPELAAACARRGVSLEPEPQVTEQMCADCGDFYTDAEQHQEECSAKQNQESEQEPEKKHKQKSKKKSL